MESKVSNSDKSGPEKSNVIKGAFGATRETSDALKRASKTPSLGTVKDELKRAVDKPSEELRTNDGRFKLLKHFFRDLGLMPDTDVHQKSKTLSNSVTLQNEIAGVRKELARELTELRQRSEPYIHAAESAGHWVVDAERFVERHSKLLWFLKRKK